jgi:hypothetical protein
MLLDASIVGQIDIVVELYDHPAKAFARGATLNGA